MELKSSSTNETWKLCTLGGFLGLFLFTLLLTNNPQTIYVSKDVRATVVAFATIVSSLPPPAPPSSTINETNIIMDGEKDMANVTESGPMWAEAGPASGEEECKMYEGRWVYKPEESPKYHVKDCPFIEEKMSCRRNGRPDFDYEGWTWESNACHIPLFDGKDMLERLRGKRMIIAGDSLNRNQWESLACLLYTSLAEPRRALIDADGPAYKLFQAKEYKMTLEFYWAPFLVHLDETHKSGKKVLSLDKLDPSSDKWRGADVMLFNSGHWWTHNAKLKSWDVFEYEGEQVEEMQTEVAYDRALSTWSEWVARNVDPAKTKVYFRSISPEHKNEHWCFNASRPIPDESYALIYPRSMIDVVEGRIREMNTNGRNGVHVSYLNITKLSSYRRDAHPSVYRFRNSKMQLETLADCSHWCLPGLPDTWNRIFYASLFFDHLTPDQVSTVRGRTIPS